MPRFCHSTEYIQQRMPPKPFCLTIKAMRSLNFCLNIRAVMSCRSLDVCPGSRPFRITSERNKQILAPIIPHVRHRILSILMQVAGRMVYMTICDYMYLPYKSNRYTEVLSTWDVQFNIEACTLTLNIIIRNYLDRSTRSGTSHISQIIKIYE